METMRGYSRTSVINLTLASMKNISIQNCMREHQQRCDTLCEWITDYWEDAVHHLFSTGMIITIILIIINKLW